VPLGLLTGIKLDLPAQVHKALLTAQPADAIKIGFETDGEVPLGDLSAADNVRILRPCGSVPVQQRVCSVYGNAMSLATDLQGLPAQQIALAGKLLHSAAPAVNFSSNSALVVQWSTLAFQRAAAFRLDQRHAAVLQQLQNGTPPIYFAGDALSPLNGWQEGALESAETAIQRLAAHHKRS
jgi:hypothetical protein